jgi:hypothetical protein
MATIERDAKTPFHLWIVGVLGLVWNSYGCYDYLMTNTRNAEYLTQFPPEMMQVIDAFPLWVMAAWAFGVWGAIAGSVLLLMRSRFAVHVFTLSLAGLIVSTAYQMTIDGPGSIKTTSPDTITIVIWVVAIFFLWYSLNQRRMGNLR